MPCINLLEYWTTLITSTHSVERRILKLNKILVGSLKWEVEVSSIHFNKFFKLPFREVLCHSIFAFCLISIFYPKEFQKWHYSSYELPGNSLITWRLICNLYCSDSLRFSVESNLGTSRIWPGVSFLFFW